MFKAIKFVSMEHKNNINRIWHIAFSHMRKQTIRTSLGMWWTVIRDIIFFAVFTMFRYLMSGGNQVENVHFIAYLITGLIPWFFMSDVINAGSSAIKSNKNIVSNLKFPITILPTIEVLAIFLRRVFTILIMFLVAYIFEGLGNFNLGLFIYYFVLMFALMISLNLITTALIAVSLDFHQLYMALARVIFYSLPIIWTFEYVEEYPIVQLLLKINPMAYIIIGFRDAFFHGNTQSLNYTMYFFVILVLMMSLGSYIQYKLRRFYSDYI